ncbi:MAG: preprotein translocase subunit SecA [Chloroflexi bacterium]|nr:preprotein translocase subunit SecA [Chloroflexota bacterium]
MLKGVVNRILGDPNEKELKRIRPIVERINALEPEFEAKSDAELRALTAEFRRRIEEETADLRDRHREAQEAFEAETDAAEAEQARLRVESIGKELQAEEERLLAEFLPYAFAAVREASKRTTGMRHFDVQLIGGVVLHEGKVAEMKTGEGKTLVATLPVYLNALAGHGAHLVTVNDYLAKRDTQWMGPIYHLLGLSVGVIQHESAFLYDPDYVASDDRYQHLRPCARREAYAADITYGTNNEFGFDYLRDNMVWDLSQCVQRELHYAIVDEVDNILIDEARTPLIISGQSEESSKHYVTFNRLVPRLQRDVDYTVDEKLRIVTLTEEGIAHVEQMLGIDNLYAPENSHLTPYLDNALRAHVLYQRDRDYIVKNGEVIIVDEFTGRLMYGRRYSEGLHQAIEAKEGVQIQKETLTLATITFQNFFRLYRKLAGMTGTAATEAEEFNKIYGLDVVVIPTNKPMIRVDHPDLVFKNERAKYRAVVQEIEELYNMGRPVLVGTTSIEKSEHLSNLLKRKGIPHQVLNAKQHEREAEIITQAGRPGAVTIATNMAGRGVDILLGGNPEGLAKKKLREAGHDLTQIDPELWQKTLAEVKAQCDRDREKVLALGGLHILGTERHEARRIDNQLRGRAGRQGDPGSSRFYLSLEDDLMRRFGGESISNIMERLGVEEDVPIEAGVVSKAIESAQTRVEGYNFDIRKHVLEYDDVVNHQREVIYRQRRQILRQANLRPQIMRMLREEIDGLVESYTAGRYREDWDLDGLNAAVRAFLPLPATLTGKSWAQLKPDEIREHLYELAERAYDEKERELGPELMRQAERFVLLQTVDRLWVRHLTDLENLREGIGLRAFAQENPLVAYKKEASLMYADLMDAVRHDVATTIFRVNVVKEPPRRPMQAVRPGVPAAAGPARPQPAKPVGQKVGRNDPCPCGSGKKYKHCHGRPEMQGEPEPAGVAAGTARPSKGARPNPGKKRR